jgi:ABC-type branched-subunit amino acid transport system substrate-binding protein
MPAAALCVLLAACSSGGSATTGSSSAVGGQSYNVSIVSDLTGPLSVVGIPSAYGAEAFFKQLNASGGINGRPVKVDVVDSQSSLPGVQSAFRQVQTANSIAALGFPGYGEPVAKQLFGSGNTTLILTFAYNSVATQPWDYTSGLLGEEILAGQLGEMKAVLGGSLQGKKLAFINSQNPTNNAFQGQLADLCAKQGCQIVDYVRIPDTLSDFTADAAAIAGKSVDGVIDIHNPTLIPTVVKALRAAGVKVPVVGTINTDSLPILQSVTDPQFYGMSIVRDQGSNSQAAKAGAKYGFGKYVDDPWYALSWASAAAVVQGLEKCGSSCDGAKFQSALTSTGQFSVPGIYYSNNVGFAPDHHSLAPNAQFYKLVDGKRTPAGPPVDVRAAEA